MRILLVGKGAPDRGGIPTFLDTLLHSRLTEQHELAFLNVAHDGTPQGGQATVGNVLRTVQDLVALWRAARGRDIVHIHSALAPTVTLLRAATMIAVARRRGCRVVVHAHGGGILLWLTTHWRRVLVRLALRAAHRVVAVWSAGEDALHQVVPRDRVRLVDNGVGVDDVPGADGGHEPPRVLFVGLLTPRKGVIDLLEASRILHKREVPHELWLLGGTPDEGPSAAAEVHRRIVDGVQLLGTRPPEEMPSAYAAADVFCLPSWWEAMPLSVLEAMAAGLPVVATDVGDIPRSVVNERTGFVVPPRSPDQLADALQALLSDPDLRRRFGAAGRAHVERHFSSVALIDAVSDLYAEMEPARR